MKTADLHHLAPLAEPLPEVTQPPEWVGQITPSRQISWKRAGTYLPARNLVQRPGSLDFAALPSKGLRC